MTYQLCYSQAHLDDVLGCFVRDNFHFPCGGAVSISAAYLVYININGLPVLPEFSGKLIDLSQFNLIGGLLFYLPHKLYCLINKEHRR